MKQPSRSIVNGTGVSLILISVILIILSFTNHCNRDMHDSVNEHGNINTQVSTMPTDSTTRSHGKTPKKKRAGSKKHTPRTYPERSPLDEPV